MFVRKEKSPYFPGRKLDGTKSSVFSFVTLDVYKQMIECYVV
jgi:hypothetical protein